MNSRDIAMPSEGDECRISRRAWTTDWRKGHKAEWSALGERYNLMTEGFAAGLEPNLDKPDDLKATDMALALGGVIGRCPNLRAVLLVGDGQWNKGGSPARRLDQLISSATPVYCVGVGDERRLPDLRIERIAAPSTALLGDYVTAQCQIVNHMRKSEKGSLSLKDSYGKQLRSEDFELSEDGEEWLTLVWEPEKEGDYDLTVSVPCPAGDSDPPNNSKSFRVTVKKDVIKALVVDAEPRWEYRFLRNALIRDQGVDVSCILTRPGLEPAMGARYLDKFPDINELSAYDVVFVGDVDCGGMLSENDIKNLRELVERRASGVVLIPGASGRLFDLAHGTRTWRRSCR